MLGNITLIENKKRVRAQDVPEAIEKLGNPKKRRKKSIQIDTTFAEERANVSELHLAALEGDIDTINQLVEYMNIDPNITDSELETPLFYALRANQRAAFERLAILGADPYADNEIGLGIPCLALYQKFINMIDGSFYHYVKVTYALNDDAKVAALNPIIEMMSKAKDVATKLGKKLLIIVGELHDSLPIYQVKKGIFKEARKMGLSVGYAERPDYTDLYCPLRKKMHEEHGYTFYPVDIARSDRSITPRALRYRETAMASEIKRIDEPGIFVTGVIHLQGFFNRFKKSTQFHVLPLNLSGLENAELDHAHERLTFATSTDKIIQVSTEGVMGNVENIVKQWRM